MLGHLRQSATSFVAWIILGVLAIAFGFSFGLPSDSIKFGGDAMLTVQGKRAAKNDFEYQLATLKFTSPYGVPKDEKVQQMMRVRERSIDAIAERLLLVHAAESIGLGTLTRDAEVLTAEGNAILHGISRSAPNLGIKDAFNNKSFEQLVKFNYLTSVKQYLEYQRQEILARTVRDLLVSSTVVSDAQVRDAYNKEANRLSLRYVEYKIDEYLDLIDPTDDEINKYVSEHTAELTTKYEGAGTRFTKLPKQVRLRLLQLNKNKDGDNAHASSTVNGARKRIASGESFSSVARELSQEATSGRKGGDFGWTSVEGTGSGLELVVDETARSLEAGQLSDIIEGDDAYYLIRIDGNREGDVEKADALRELASDEVKKGRAGLLARQAATEDMLGIQQAKDMEAYFKPKAPTPDEVTNPGSARSQVSKPELRTTGLFPKDSAIPALGKNTELTDKAWNAKPEDFVLSKIFETKDGFIIASVAEKQTGTEEEFGEGRAKRARDLSRRKAQQVLSAMISRTCSEAVGRGDIKTNMAQLKRLTTYNIADVGKGASNYQVCDTFNGGGMFGM